MRLRCIMQAGMICVALWLVALSAGAMPSTVYTRTDNVQVRGGVRATDPVLATLPRNTELRVTGQQGTRYEVQLGGGQKGYVPRLKVSTTAPRESRRLLMGMGTSSITVSESDSVAGLRGLSEAAKKLAEAGQLSQQEVAWVETMEALSRRVTKQHVQDFLEQGGIGF